MKEFDRGRIVGIIFSVVGIGLLAMGGIALLSYVSIPVAEIVGEALGSFGSSFNISRGNSVQSIAVLCIIIIGVIGIIKVITRRK